MSQPKGREPGIYFDLPDQEYHSDPAISCSNIKDLLVSPMKYWWNSPLNPKRKLKETPSMKMGKALHCYLMEKERFNRDYIVLPKLEIDSDFYRSESQKADFGQNYALRKTKDAKTFEYIGSKITLSENDFSDIKERVEYFESLPTAGVLFQDGYMEVSIFWRDEETGLMCKCRPDYLTPNYIADYKSIEDIKKIKNHIGDYDYYLQMAFYLEGLSKIRPLLKNKEVANESGLVPTQWWQDFYNNTHNNFIFAFQEKEDLLVRLKTFNEGIIESAQIMFRQGLNIYKKNLEKYGVDRWEDDYKKIGEGDIEVLGWEDLPVWVQYKYV